jgi:gamma-glutamyltranspeptidase/glutathione hydrolase
MKYYLLFLLLPFAMFSQDRPYGKLWATRSQVIAQNGMAATSNPLSTQVALDVLKAGGNAIDAAIAVNFALAVCHPSAGNIGGGGFLVYRNAKGKFFALDYREKAPLASTKDMYLDASGNVIPEKSMVGIFSVGVPGTVAGMEEMHRKFGLLPWKDLIQPAIDIARNGHALTSREARGLNANKLDFIKENKGNSYLINPNNIDWKKDDQLIQMDLANTLERILRYKSKGFYQGKTAELIIGEMNRLNGIITQKDLNGYKPVWRKPIVQSYKNFQIIGMPPPSSGGIALAQLMGMVQKYPLSKWGVTSDSTVQLMIESERRVFADRAKWLGDPDFVQVPIGPLLDSTYIKNRISSIDFTKASLSSDISAGQFSGYESPETTHYSIVDAAGNAVSITTTLNNSFGSKVFVGGAGFLLNDEMDDFSAKAGAPNLYGLIGSKANEIQPMKRMLSSMTPTIITENGQLKMVVGTPGGSTIITSVFQVVLNALEFGMNMQQAVEYPRFHQQWKPEQTRIEPNRMSTIQMERLKRKGYEFSNSASIGLVEGILVLPSGKLQGGADSRGDDTALGHD